MDIQDILQVSQFKSTALKAEVNLYYTSSWFNHQKAETLRKHRLTLQQFNVLRILKGQQPNPASVKLIGERMIDKMSNVSRIIDRLLSKGLVDRRECPADRRQVDIKITEAGLRVVQEASRSLEKTINHVMLQLSEEELEQLNRMLDKLRTD